MEYLFLFIFLIPLAAGATILDDFDEDDGPSMSLDDNVNRTYMQQLNKIQNFVFKTKKYDRKLRPVRNQSLAVTISLHLHIVHVSVDEHDQTMTVHGHLYMVWTDEFLYWDPVDFNMVRMMHTNRWEVWGPEIKVSNSVGGSMARYEISPASHVLVQTKPDETARVETYPTFSIKVACDFDFSDFPYDEHTCPIRLYTPKRMNEVTLELYQELDPTLILSWSNQSEAVKKHIGDFEIANVTNNITYERPLSDDHTEPVTAADAAQTWTVATIYVRVRRNAPTFSVLVVLPLAFCSIITSLSLFIAAPLHAFYVNVALVPISMLFVHEFVATMPPTATQDAPPVAVFYALFLVITAFIAILHILFLSVRSWPSGRYGLLKLVNAIRSLTPKGAEPYDKECALNLEIWDRGVSIFRSFLAIPISFIFFQYFMTAFVF